MGNSDDMLSFNNLYEQEMNENGSGLEGTDINFLYSDTDSHFNEIAELYSYTEHPEFQLNVKAFEDEMETFGLAPCWQNLDVEQQRNIILKLIDQLDHTSRDIRMRAARCVLYLAQGCWAEVQSDKEQYQVSRGNVMLLYEQGAYTAFVELLNYESSKSTATPLRKVVLSLADCEDLRVILSVLYIITEVIRYEMEQGTPKYKTLFESFSQEILISNGDEILIAKLLGMVTKFCSGVSPHFPIKKILLLLWKVSLVGLGGMADIKRLKNEKRVRYGLEPSKEDTLEVGKQLRASSPPTIASDVLDNQNPKRNRPFRRVRTNDMLQEQSLMKQSSLDEQEQINIEMENSRCQQEGEEELSDFYRTYDDPMSLNGNSAGGSENRSSEGSEGGGGLENWMQAVEKEEEDDVDLLKASNRLPWEPKVRQKDVDLFLDLSRHKFLGYTLNNDRESEVGLPRPILEGIRTLKEHMYVSLADLQIKREEEIARNPISNTEGVIDQTPAEIVYQAILPNLPQCMIALLKILLAASPTSKSKTETINIMVDVFPEELPVTVIQTTKLGIDVNRHKEIIVKAVSAILLLYLKHFKLNHVYQFEYMSQHLVFANCIPLVLKFFNQNIICYVGSKNTIPIMDFPACVIGEQPEMTAESLVIGDSASYTWRNVFSCVNLLRILNKLTKSKHSRIMMLVVFKSAPILKRTLKVRYGLMQLYVLKLLKMQTKYLGRQWRKCNMKTISAIYLKVRHRFNDDWAFGNDLDARPWDFQAEECMLRTCVDRFNSRRYPNWNRNLNNNINNGLGIGGTTNGQQSQQAHNNNGMGEYHNQGLDYLLELNEKNLNADLEDMELSDEFKEHYELWLEQEVYNNDINWDLLMVPVEG